LTTLYGNDFAKPRHERPNSWPQPKPLSCAYAVNVRSNTRGLSAIIRRYANTSHLRLPQPRSTSIKSGKPMKKFAFFPYAFAVNNKPSLRRAISGVNYLATT
jgi:hypothetical protein